jgi:hypothetical protein
LIHKAIDILKVRWPEVMLVVVLQAAMLLLADEVVMLSENPGERGPTLPFGVNFLLGLGMMLCAIGWQMIYLGFLRTSAVSGGVPQQPMQLLRTGRPLFWRILFFQVLLGFVLLFLNTVIASLVGGLVWQDRSLIELPSWFTQICALVGLVIVLKPLLLVPAQMIVYNTTVFQSISRIRFYRISRIESFLKVIIISFVVIALSTLLVGFLAPQNPTYYIVSGLHHTVFSFILLTLTLITVLQIQQYYETERVNERENDT